MGSPADQGSSSIRSILQTRSFFQALSGVSKHSLKPESQVFNTALGWEGRSWGAGESEHTGQHGATALGAESLPVLAQECPGGLYLPRGSLFLLRGEHGPHDNSQP